MRCECGLHVLQCRRVVRRCKRSTSLTSSCTTEATPETHMAGRWRIASCTPTRYLVLRLALPPLSLLDTHRFAASFRRNPLLVSVLLATSLLSPPPVLPCRGCYEYPDVTPRSPFGSPITVFTEYASITSLTFVLSDLVFCFDFFLLLWSCSSALLSLPALGSDYFLCLLFDSLLSFAESCRAQILTTAFPTLGSFDLSFNC
ncbi:hypothetical protein B0H13DRAFT_2672749 [Mycena leptocephala]|nr:hypothetical protein B0H13DRAFT_2672749 [Mycena leptocephala]